MAPGMWKCFGADALWEGSFGNVKTVQRCDLQASMSEASALVQPWDTSSTLHVRDLQDAARNFGKVQLMRNAAGGGLMAVKRMPNRWACTGPRQFDERYPTATEKPWVDVGLVRLLNSLDYPYACRLHGIFRSGQETFIASAFCSEGDLFDWSLGADLPPAGVSREAAVRPILAQVVAAVRDLHDLGVAHRDLSLENILLTRSGDDLVVKLIDFGMATLERNVRHELRGKLFYLAPEIHTNASVDTFLADEFALGVVFYAVATGDYLWTTTQQGKCQIFEYISSSGLRPFLQKRRLRSGNGETLSEVLSPGFVDVIEALLQMQPKKRACLGEVAFQEEVRRQRRKSVWDLAYLHGAEALLPSHPSTTDAKSGDVKPTSACTSTCCGSSVEEPLVLEPSSPGKGWRGALQSLGLRLGSRAPEAREPCE